MSKVKDKFASVVAKLQKTEDKLERSLNRYDDKLDNILVEQDNFLNVIQSLFEQIINLFRIGVSLLDVASNSADLLIYLIPAGMILFVCVKLTQII